jgi:rSAM/selenodomain-associated transferase 2
VRPLASVVVPVLDEARALPGLLDHLAALPGRWEVVVSDGGSGDGSAELARRHPLRPQVVAGPRGRARQLNAGAAAAGGDVLVFLHADSRLPADAYRSLAGALRDPSRPGGNFAVRFDGADRFSRGLTRWYAVQRRLGVYYGDSALWLRRGEWEALGGFAELAIMEDLELVRRLERRGRTASLPGPVLSSPRRWRALGWWRTGLAWTVIRWAWLAGVPAERLARLYPAVR